MSGKVVSQRIFRVVSRVFLLTLLPTTARADMPGPTSVDIAPYFLILFFVVVVVTATARLLLLGLRRLLSPARSVGAKPFKRFRIDVIIAAVIVIGLFVYTLIEMERYSRRPRTSEAKSNLGAIRSTEVAYFAEWSMWVGNQPPTPVADRSGRKDKVAWDSTTRFSILGFAPEGKVYCSYTLEGPDYPTEAQGFTARAECDYDGDGSVSVFTITNASTEIVHSGGTF